MARVSKRILILTLIVLAGCQKGPPVVPVSGRVTVHGAPVENVVVTFTPRSDSLNPGVGSFGCTDAQGRYALTVAGTERRGVLVGRHHVTLLFRDPAVSRMTEEELAIAVKTGTFPDAGLPPHARDGSLEFLVGPRGTNQADFNF